MRTRPLSATLAVAWRIAVGIGVTRLADLTHLDPLGIPNFQAVRPLARSLSASQGKGLTPLAAQVSALVEAIELHCAETVDVDRDRRPLSALDPATVSLWHGAARETGALRLDLATCRSWLDGVDLATGRHEPVPADLVCMDYTRTLPTDAAPTTTGLSAGNTLAEAQAGGLAELLEHDAEARWRALPADARRATEIDLATIDDPMVVALARRIVRAGRSLRLWSIGPSAGVAVVLATICDEPGCDTDLPPVSGSGCHPDRAIAATRAILEAAQGRVTLIAGSRDDILPSDYAEPGRKRLMLALSMLSFGPGPLAWRGVPHHPVVNPEQALALLLDDAIRASPLPVLSVTLAGSDAELPVVRIVAPGLLDGHRRPPPPRTSLPRPPTLRTSTHRLLFGGPTIHGLSLPPGVEQRPPAVAGDLAALLDDPPAAIGLIDGCFEQAPSVWHKEIIDLAAAGCIVMGAASLGALRAAELPEAMVGVGTIYAAYRDGLVTRDDAVMVTHAPAALGYRPLTLALVDAEAALLAVAMPAEERRSLQRIIRTLSFRKRSWSVCLDAYRTRTGHNASVIEPELDNVPSLKQADARLLIAALAGPLPPLRQVTRPPLTLFYGLINPAI